MTMSLQDIILPNFGGRWGEVDLHEEAGLCFRYFDFPNPLLDPEYFHFWLMSIHRRKGINYSYGGYGENRALLWRGSYLDPADSIHLGVDYNTLMWARVHAACDCTVVHSWHDKDQNGGWGGRVVFKVSDDLHYVYGHLDSRFLPPVGKEFKRGDYVSVIGPPEDNGGWFRHLHVQCIRGELPEDFDGYGTREMLDKFPDPRVALVHE